MKYAFIIGTNAYVVPQGVISYADDENSKEILRVRSIYHDTAPGSFLSVDADIKDNDGHEVKIKENKAVSAGTFTVRAERNSVQLFKHDGSLIIQVHQLDEESAMSLESNIVPELERNSPIAVIRVNGDFMAEGLHIVGENEKLYINDDGYATSALAGDSLRFTPSGLVL